MRYNPCEIAKVPAFLYFIDIQSLISQYLYLTYV